MVDNCLTLFSVVADNTLIPPKLLWEGFILADSFRGVESVMESALATLLLLSLNTMAKSNWKNKRFIFPYGRIESTVAGKACRQEQEAFWQSENREITFYSYIGRRETERQRDRKTQRDKETSTQREADRHTLWERERQRQIQ